MGGILVYETAITCAQNEDLRAEWEKYLEQTKEHEVILRNVFNKLEMGAEAETLGRTVVRHIGESLVEAMEIALDSDELDSAQLVAAECVVLAETKDHLNWELIGAVATSLPEDERKVLMGA